MYVLDSITRRGNWHCRTGKTTYTVLLVILNIARAKQVKVGRPSTSVAKALIVALIVVRSRLGKLYSWKKIRYRGKLMLVFM